jgi:Fuc2NAc and GlcNAc transferase
LPAATVPASVPIVSVLTASAAAALVSLAAAGVLMRCAPRIGLQDLPNARSSHRLPTPRGGGAGIVVAFLLALPWCLPDGLLATWPVRLALAAGIMLAIVGLADDLRGLGLAVRLAAQALAVAVLLAVLAGSATPATESDIGVLRTVTGLPSLSTWLPASTAPWLVGALDLAMIALLMLAGVWWINLYNFMDGIDGLAVTQALFMLVAALLIKYAGSGMDADTSLDRFLGAPASAASVVLIGASAGFLVLNWAPAKIFLGDAGSLFLGFSIFATAAHDVTFGDMSVWSWLILGALFFVDATATLLRRWLTGQRVTAAHRTHLYQRLSRRWGRQWAVALVYFMINVTWIFPLALLAHRASSWAPMILVIACSPLAVVAWRAGAGLKE